MAKHVFRRLIKLPLSAFAGSGLMLTASCAAPSVLYSFGVQPLSNPAPIRRRLKCSAAETFLQLAASGMAVPRLTGFPPADVRGLAPRILGKRCQLRLRLSAKDLPSKPPPQMSQGFSPVIY
ncbi:MAG: hypothetical protein LBU32_22345 [Clostridiales bacterium]|nr:hypothetical protein [Clostridiales bacterium]